jgi:hypothetical protein
MNTHRLFKTLVFILALGIAGVALRQLNAGAHAAGTAASAEPGPATPAVRSREELIERYPAVPRDEIVDDVELLTELQARYRTQLDALRKQVDFSGARLVVAYLTPEYNSEAQQVLEPFLESLSAGMGIEYVNLSPQFRGLDPLTYTQMPRDGHWSAAGAAIVARGLGDILRVHAADRSAVAAGRRPALFGDLEPAQDVILDGGKSLPYRLETNAQGLRLDHELEFPKTRQRVLLLGDSQIYCPFLDNPDTIGAHLQRMFPDREIVSAANLGYGLDDLEGLFRERARFVEPDLVIVQTGGGDVLDNYFSHRNLFSRTRAAFEPTAVEERFYRRFTKPTARQ